MLWFLQIQTDFDCKTVQIPIDSHGKKVRFHTKNKCINSLV